MITEERKANGLFLKCDLTFNTTIANLEQYKSGPALSDAKMVKATAKQIKIMRTKCMGPDDMISSLSGGNQQKVLISRWLASTTDILLLDEPTRGVDVNTKQDIYQLMGELTAGGMSVVFVSSELAELLNVCDRIMVMSDGKTAGTLERTEFDQETIMQLATQEFRQRG